MTPRITVEQWQEDWWKVAELAVAMADFTPEAMRLAAIVPGPDGFGNGAGARGGPGTVSNPVLATVLRLAGGSEGDTPDTWALNGDRDRIGELLDKLFEQTEQLGGCARRIAGLKRLIEKRGDARYGRQSTVTDCLACDASVSGVGEDRIKAGYGPCCYRAWLRYRVAEATAGRDANREMFRRRRLRELAS